MVQGQANRGGWANGPVTLFHGTTDGHVTSLRSGIGLALCRPDTDFGQGFYTTTLERQARRWAADRAALAGGNPVVLPFVISRDLLGALHVLAFVRGGVDAEDYWHLVRACRQGGVHRPASPADPWYDIVMGPVAANWRRRESWRGYDQVSFHAAAAVHLLNASMQFQREQW